MAIFTPLGLKIRLPVAYAFALIGRLHPRVSAFKVLKTAEGIQLLPSMYYSTFVLLCAFLDMRPLYMGIIGTVIYTINYWMRPSSVVFPGEITVGKLYNYTTIWGMNLIIVVGGCALLGGWKSAVAAILARGLGDCLHFHATFCAPGRA